MKKYYNNTKYDTAFDRWTGIVSELMMKYGPHVLSRQRLQKSVDKGKVDILPEEKPLSRVKRLLTYHRRIAEASEPVDELQNNLCERRIA